MAKPTKYAPHICTGVSILALLGIIIGLISSQAIITIIFLIPAAVYEAYRTEGKSTKAASYLLLLVLFLEIILVIFKIEFNVAEFLGASQKMIGGYWVPLGDLRILGPSILAVLSVILFTRTRGIYTRWLAVTIFITSFAIVYILDPVTFQELLKYGVNEGLRRL